MTRDRKRVLAEYLVIAAQSGDRGAFTRLARLWQPDLLRHAARLLGEAEASRDAVQDAWLDIVRGLPRLREPVAFPAWAFRIVTRKCTGLIRSRQLVRATASALTDEPHATSVDGAGLAEQAADVGHVREAMAALPDEQRLALALHYQDGLTLAEISVVTDVPLGTVKTRLMHARRKLTDQLDPDRN